MSCLDFDISCSSLHELYFSLGGAAPAVGETTEPLCIKKIFLARMLLGKEWEQILGLAGQLPIENEAI